MHEDMERVERMLGGDLEPLAEVREELQPDLLRTLMAKGASEPLAMDLLAKLWHDCIPRLVPAVSTSACDGADAPSTGSPAAIGTKKCRRSPLEGYTGAASLKTYFTRVLINSYIDHLRKESKFVLSIDSSNGDEGRSFPEPFVPPSPFETEDNITKLLKHVLTVAFAQVSPDIQVMLRLVHYHEIKQKQLAAIWGCHEATISRQMDHAIETLRKTAIKELNRCEPGLILQWEDIQRLCAESDLTFL